MNTPEALVDRLRQRFVRLERKLDILWKNDPTVLAGFLADFEGLIGDLESGEVPQNHARSALNAIYEEHLPVECATGGHELNLPSRSARPVPGHGQFYRLIRPGVWKAIDYTESMSYRAADPNRAIWLTYANGPRQAL